MFPFGRRVGMNLLGYQSINDAPPMCDRLACVGNWELKLGTVHRRNGDNNIIQYLLQYILLYALEVTLPNSGDIFDSRFYR